jgi:TusA-related sulfurtransferase
MRKLQPGHILQVVTTDINSPSNMTAWSRQSGNELLDMYDEDGRFVFYFRRSNEAADASKRLVNVAGPS